MSEFTTNDPTNASSAKQLKKVSWQRLAGDFVVTRDREVPHGTEPVTPTFGVLESGIDNERNIAKSRQVTQTVSTAFTDVVDRQLVEPNLDKFVCSKVITSKFVAFGTSPDTGTLVLSSKVEEVNKANALRVTETTSAFNDIVGTKVETDGSKVQTTESIIGIATAAPANTIDTVVEKQALSCTKALLTTTTKTTNPTTIVDISCEPDTCLQQVTTRRRLTTALDGITFDGTSFDLTLAKAAQDCLPGTESSVKQEQTSLYLTLTELVGWEAYERITYVTENFTFPSYLLEDGIITGTHFLADVETPQTLFFLNFDIRWAWTEPVEMKVVETLVDTPLAPPAGLVTWQTKDILYDGVMFKVQLNNILVDGFVLTATTHSDDVYYGSSVSEPLTVTSTTYSASDYVAAVASGDWQLIRRDYVPWKFCLFKQRDVYVKFK